MNSMLDSFLFQNDLFLKFTFERFNFFIYFNIFVKVNSSLLSFITFNDFVYIFIYIQNINVYLIRICKRVCIWWNIEIGKPFKWLLMSRHPGFDILVVFIKSNGDFLILVGCFPMMERTCFSFNWGQHSFICFCLFQKITTLLPCQKQFFSSFKSFRVDIILGSLSISK